MAYTAYTTVVGLADDATRPVTWLGYAALWGLVPLARTDRVWAWRVVAAALALLLAVGVFYYPTIFVPARQTTFGWFENDAYMGLLLLAEYLCIQRLRGVTLTPGA